jgi:toxin CptA
VTLAVAALGVLGAFSVLGSEMPRTLAWPLALASATRGIGLSMRESRRPRRELAWPIDGQPQVDGQRLRDARLHWRGPLAFLSWRDDAECVHRLAWWPDTLPLPLRRELRLAATSAADRPSVASMAP